MTCYFGILKYGVTQNARVLGRLYVALRLHRQHPHAGLQETFPLRASFLGYLICLFDFRGLSEYPRK